MVARWKTARLEAGLCREGPADRGPPLVSNNRPVTIRPGPGERERLSQLDRVWRDRGYGRDRRRVRTPRPVNSQHKTPTASMVVVSSIVSINRVRCRIRPERCERR